MGKKDHIQTGKMLDSCYPIFGTFHGFHLQLQNHQVPSMHFLNEDGLRVGVLLFHSFREALGPGSSAEELVAHHLCGKDPLMIPVAAQIVIIHGYMPVLQNVLSLLATDHGEDSVLATSLMQIVMLDNNVSHDWNGVLHLGDSFAFSFWLG